MRKNKKAQIATILAPVLALVLAATAAFLMASFSNTLESRSLELSKISGEVVFNEQYVISEIKALVRESVGTCQDCDERAIKEEIIGNLNNVSSYFRNDGAGNFYSLTKAGNFNFEEVQEEGYKIKFEDLFVFSEREHNKIIRTFDLCLEFNNLGEYRRDCPLNEE